MSYMECVRAVNDHPNPDHDYDKSFHTDSQHITSDLFRSKNSLVEEIHQLRSKLEDTVMEGKSMTSPKVILISSILDDKINEYMKSMRRGS